MVGGSEQDPPRGGARTPECAPQRGRSATNTTLSLKKINAAGKQDAGSAESLLHQEAPQQSAANGQERAANGALRSPPGRHRRPRCRCGGCTKICVIILLVLLIGSVIGNIYQAAKSPKPTPVAPCSLCPQGWLCNGIWTYFFSSRESNWTNSRNNCSSLGGSLVRLETETEKDYIMKNMKKDLYWLGIWRKDKEPWNFPNVSIFHNLSLNEKEGNCAFLNEDQVDSSVCSFSRLWICRKPHKAH